MTSRIACAAVLILTACSQRWNAFESKEGGFSVEMPGHAEEKRGTQSTRLGDADTRMATVRAGTLAFHVGWMQFAVQRLPVQDLLDAATQPLRDAGWAVDAGRDVSLVGVPAREFHLTRPGGEAWTRLFVAGRRVYAATFEQPSGGVHDDVRERFFGSHRVESATLRALREIHVCAPYDCRVVARTELGFALDLPLTPKESYESVDLSIGRYERHVQRVTTTPVLLELGTIRLPYRPAGAPPYDLGELAGELARAWGASVKQRRPVKLGGVDAIEIRMEKKEIFDEGPSSVVTRVAIHSLRLHEVAVAFPPGELAEDEIEAWFGTFRFREATASN